MLKPNVVVNVSVRGGNIEANRVYIDPGSMDPGPVSKFRDNNHRPATCGYLCAPRCEYFDDRPRIPKL